MCEATWGWTRPDDDLSVSTDTDYLLDGALVQPRTDVGSLKDKVPNCAFFNVPLTAGNHQLEVSVKNRPDKSNGNGYVALAYLIWW